MGVSYFVGAAAASANMSEDHVTRFIVANLAFLCHKRAPDRPAEQGLPWRSLRVLSATGKTLAFSTL
jgi:hypothetical protein